MKNENLALMFDYIPCRVNGCLVNIYFPSAHAPEGFVETNPESIEQTLMATYKKSNAVEKM